ncbi:MAG: tetratricopeptide repeat protein [Gemmataceae bacterium]
MILQRWLRIAMSAILLLPAGCGKPKQDGSAERQKALDAMGQSDWDTVIKHSDEAIRLEPGIADIFWVRGTAHLKKKDYAKAEADLNQALKLDAELTPVFRERGLTYLGQEKYDKAIDDFTVYIKKRPDDPEVYGYRALAHNKKGDTKAASADLRAMDKLKGQDNPNPKGKPSPKDNVNRK